MTDTTHAGWKGNTEDRTGTATLAAGGKAVQIHFQCFEDYMAVQDIIRLARQDALQAQATYLRGVIGRLLDQQ